MALTLERIAELEQQSYVKGHRPVRTEDCWGDEKITYEPTEHFNMFMFARAIEDEVHAQDDALILQLVEALERVRFDSLNMTIKDMQACGVAVGAARAHLGTNPPPGPNAPKPTA